MIALKDAARSFLVGPILDADGVAKTDEVVGNIIVTKNGTPGAPNGATTLTHDHTGHYVLAANGGDMDTLGEVTFSLNSGANAMGPVDFQVVPVKVYNSMVAGSDNLEVDAIQISGDATAADNLESQYDATGLSGDTFPATQAAVANIGAASGGAINFAASEDNTGGAIDPSAAAFVGSVIGGTYASTQSGDGIVHDIDDVGDDIDIVYGFEIGGGRMATQTSIIVGVAGVGDAIKVKAYDHTGGGAWDIIGTLAGTPASTLAKTDLSLLGKHSSGTGAEVGKVYIRFETDATTPSNLSVDMCLVAAVSTNRTVGYSDGSIWIDSAGIAGSENYVNGTADNPCPYANALVISASLGINRFHVANGNTVTLTANSDNKTFEGDAWTLVLAGQSIAGFYAEGADISGVGTGATKPRFERCDLTDVTLPPSHLRNCGLGGTLTLADAGIYCLDGCHSMVAGVATPVIDFQDAAENKELNMRAYSGGVEIRNIGQAGSTDAMSLEGWGQLILAATCEAATIAIRGHFTVTDNVVGGWVAGAGGTLSDEARFDVAAITGGEYALDTDANGRVRIVDGVGAGEINTNAGAVVSVGSVTDGVTLADDAITAAKFDESTAFPVKADDAGATQIARVGADGDTLETLSDEIAAIAPLDAAGIRTAVGLGAANLDTQLGALPTNAELGTAFLGIQGADGDTLETLSDQIDGVTAPTPAAVADAVWDESQVGHVIAGSFGLYLDAKVSSAVGGSVSVTPLHAEATIPTLAISGGTEQRLTFAKGSSTTTQYGLTDADGTAVNLTGKVLRFAVYDADLTVLFNLTIAGGQIILTDPANGQFTVEVGVLVTAAALTANYVLWNVTDEDLLSTGAFIVESVLGPSET
ncbi:MAG TPA: hypothetical protein VM118_06880 [Acidobacteriota bacterium]|nr:hypothetical protein [Acidobacteriota bacterium]